MDFKRQGDSRLRIKSAGYVIFLLALLITLSGCAWIANWFNPNQDPIATITATPISGEAPLEVVFDASQSYDPDGGDLRFEWDFGDGTAAEGQTVRRGFASPGRYTVRLLVTDDRGAHATKRVTISVSQPPDETTEKQTFELRTGIEHDTGTGLKVSVPPAPTEGEARLIVAENPTPQQPPGGFIELQSVFSISITSPDASPAQQIAPRSGVQDPSKVRLTFEIPPGVDPRFAMILYWTDEGWVLASSGEDPEGLASLGGEVAPDGRYISIKVEQLSRFAVAWVQWEGNLDIAVVPMVQDTKINEDGNLITEVVLESPQGIFLGLGKGAWYKIDVSKAGLQFLAVKAPDDALFGRLTENSGFIAPGENKRLVFMFYGTGGSTYIHVSLEGAFRMAIADYLYRAKTGKRMPWPLSAEMLKDKTVAWAIDEVLGDGMSELIMEIRAAGTRGGVRVLLGWLAEELGGLWWRLAGTAELAVATVIYNFLAAGDSIEIVAQPLSLQVVVEPSQSTVKTGESIQFRAKATTAERHGEQSLSTSRIQWEVTGGGTIDQNGLFTAAQNESGSFTVRARVLSVGRGGVLQWVVGEATVIVTAPLPPDLTVTSVALSKSSAQVGDTISVTFTVENRGGPVSEEFQNRVFLSTTRHGGQGGQDIPLGDFSMSLTGTTFRTETVEVAIPQVPTGNRYIVVYADSTTVIDESNENNNIRSASISITAPPTEDRTSPTTPTNLRATAVSSTQIDLVWTASTDNVGVSGYKIYRDGTRVAEVGATSHSVTALAPSTRYYFTVSAFDAAGNESGRSRQADATTLPVPETNQPPVITDFRADPTIVQPGGQSRISVSAHDPENNPMTYTWSATGGTLSSITGPGGKTWTAPNTPGTYTVSVSVIDNEPGRAPVSRSVSITVETVPIGSLQVTIEPSGARAAGAQWRLTSGPDTGWKNSGAFIHNLPAGSTYTITFRSVSGWTAPGNQSVTIIANATVPREATYQPVQQHGSLQVTIEPSGARAAGAQWRLTSGPDTGWKNSGAFIHNLPAGSTYTITFRSVSGWTAPGNQSVTIIANATVPREATYQQAVAPPKIASASPSPSTVTSGGTITITYNVTNPGTAMTVLLGASIQLPGGTALSDPANDRRVTISSGYSSVSRPFVVPTTAPSGTYNLLVSLVEDVNNNNRIDAADWNLDSRTFTGVLQVGQPVDPPLDVAPTHTLPSNRATGVFLTPTFTWRSVPNADRYALYISEPPYGAENLVYWNVNITGTSLTLPSGRLREGVTYYWNMRAGNDAGWGPFSSSWSFTTLTTVQAPTERLTNGSFNQGTHGWTLRGDFWAGTGFPYYRTSPGYAAGGVNSGGGPTNSAVGWMHQTVTIPSRATSATLSFWYNITSDEPGTTARDVLLVTIQDPGGAHLAMVAVRSNRHKVSLRGDYRQITFDVTQFRGQTIRVDFLVTTNASNYTIFRIDDVSLMSDG